MQEALSGREEADDQTRLRVVRGAGNVALRFECYKYAVPYFDIDEAIIKHLDLNGDERIVDRGTYKGDMLVKLRQDHDHSGELIGIDPFHKEHYLPSDDKRTVLYTNPNKLSLDHIERLGALGTRYFDTPAQKLPGGKNSVDVVMDRFMMYMVPPSEQVATIREAIRVLKPDGRYVLSTSSDFNKPRHRIFEEIISRGAGVEPPRHMNESFDSERAAAVLPELFQNVYHYSYRGHMVFRRSQEARAYYNSHLSMAAFYNPPIEEFRMRNLIGEVIVPRARREISVLGRFVDFIERDFFICSNGDKGVRINTPHGAEIIHGYYRKDDHYAEDEWLHAGHF